MDLIIMNFAADGEHFSFTSDHKLYEATQSFAKKCGTYY